MFRDNHDLKEFSRNLQGNLIFYRCVENTKNIKCGNAIISYLNISRLRLHLRLLLETLLNGIWRFFAPITKIKLHLTNSKRPEWNCQFIEIIFFYNITVCVTISKTPMLQTEQGKFQSSLMPKQQGKKYQYMPPLKVNK